MDPPTRSDRTRVLKCLALLTVVSLTLSLYGTVLMVWAHGIGTPQLINEPAGPYALFVWTDPDPLRVDETHVTVAVTDPETRAPILNAQVEIRLEHLSEDAFTLSATATHDNSDIRFFYVATFEELPFAGRWRGVISVANPEGTIEPVAFVFSVLPAEPVNWLLIVLPALGVVAFAWIARSWHWARVRRKP